MKTIHVVDDDPSIRKALERLLKATGHSVEAFASAEDFLERLGGRAIDCLVLDLRLTGMSGLELQDRLALEGWRVPIIFITAHDDPQIHEQAMRSGAACFLRKPFDEASLLDAIETIFRRRDNTSESS
jgi:FixJ family two-component response regulator